MGDDRFIKFNVVCGCLVWNCASVYHRRRILLLPHLEADKILLKEVGGNLTLLSLSLSLLFISIYIFISPFVLDEQI